MYDTIMGDLRCPRCGQMSSVDMTTRLRDEPDASFFKVGDALPINHVGMDDSGYLPIQAPSEPVRICHIWACSHCDRYPNWAEVIVHDGRIESIEAVRLDRAAIERLHYLDDEARYFIADRAGLEYEAVPRNEAIAVLRRYLEQSPELV